MSLLIVTGRICDCIKFESSTADADHAHGRFLFLSQTMPDNSQIIIKRIGELQKQIDELRRQIETLPPGPPGPPGRPGPTGKPVVTQRSSDYCSLPEGSGGGLIKCIALCNSDEIVVGGGYDTPPLNIGQVKVIRSEFASENGWSVIEEVQDDTCIETKGICRMSKDNAIEIS